MKRERYIYGGIVFLMLAAGFSLVILFLLGVERVQPHF